MCFLNARNWLKILFPANESSTLVRYTGEVQEVGGEEGNRLWVAIEHYDYIIVII